ncbi:hypothetical protein [Legionella waltersii]|uniref:Coiled-coil protein n=1 Tax=Legionella waltersii TaxID=66969 RepID=A0A0W1ADB7_9GAMM|nr:hypothetical protein [Legionella waltersii]KTD79327.1 hypothetical protein Lwal_1399 [Legionella waltersii]SNV13076.1 Uncharacterised protein [Legionella waltersii]
MDEVTVNVRQVHVTDIDSDVPESIVVLDNKLKDMLTTVESKLMNPLAYTGDDLRGYLVSLKNLEKELEGALNGVFTLVNFMSSKDKDFKELFYNGEEMESFSEFLAESLSKLEEAESKN